MTQFERKHGLHEENHGEIESLGNRSEQQLRTGSSEYGPRSVTAARLYEHVAAGISVGIVRYPRNPAGVYL